MPKLILFIKMNPLKLQGLCENLIEDNRCTLTVKFGRDSNQGQPVEFRGEERELLKLKKAFEQQDIQTEFVE